MASLSKNRDRSPKELPIVAHRCRCIRHTCAVDGIFYGLDLKKEMVVSENKPRRSLDVKRKRLADSKSKLKNSGTHATYMVNSRLEKVAEVIL